MENVYKICFYGGLALAIIFLIVSVVLFFVLKIPKVINDLTGRTAKKQIDEIKKKNTESSEVSKKEQAKYYNQGSGKITVKESMSPATRAANRDNTTDLLEGKSADASMNKEEQNNNRPAEYNPDETQVLGAGGIPEDGEEETTVLSKKTDAEAQTTTSDTDTDDEATAVLKADEGDDEATDVLKSDEADNTDTADDEATDVLKSDNTDEAEDEATDVLKSDNTDVADDEATDVLKADEVDDEATDVLRATDTGANDDEPATDVLRADMINKKKPYNAKVICDVVITHTNESV